MEVIYKVTSKKVTALLEEEIDRKTKFMNNILKPVKKILKGVLTVAYRTDPWDNRIITYGIVFSEEGLKQNDMSMWKRVGEGFLYYRGNPYKVWIPRRKTKKEKELYTKVTGAMKKEKFFQGDHILEALNYKPKEKLEDISVNRVRSTAFSPGWYFDKKTGKRIFMFRGFNGYEPPAGVKEMLPSEYNKLMEKK